MRAWPGEQFIIELTAKDQFSQPAVASTSICIEMRAAAAGKPAPVADDPYLYIVHKQKARG